jgi:hypothetical protein
MAKEISVKIKIDGQEIDVAKKSTKELNEQIGDLRKKLEEVPVGSKDFKKITGDINALETGFQKAKQQQQGFIQNLSELPGLAGTVGQSLKGVKGAFDLLAQNPLIAVFSLLATILLKVIDKMKNLEGVMDPLEKISKSLSGVLDVLANTILPPVAAALELIAEGASKAANFFGKLFGSSNDVGDAMGYVADSMDALADSQAAFNLAQEESNRKLQEAREIAGDSTKTIAVRVQALKDAEVVERDLAEKNRKRALDKAKAQAVELAVSLNATQQQIDAIKKYDSASLKSYLDSVQQLKGLNREKSDALYASLGEVERISADEARIGKKTQSQITALEKSEQAARVQAGKDAAAKKKDYEDRLAAFQNDIRTLSIKDEQEKARVSLQIEKEKSLKEIANLDMTEKRKAALKKAALEDYALKEKALTEKQQKENEDRKRAFDYKIELLDIEQYNKELDRQKATIDAKAHQDKIAMTNDNEFKKQSKEEQVRILALIDQKAVNDKKKLDEDAAKKDAELIYKRIEFERQSRLQGFQNKLKEIELEFTTEQQKALERKAILDKQAEEDYNKEMENLKKLLDAKEITQKEYDDRQVVNQETKNLKLKENEIKTTQEIVNAKTAQINAELQLAQAIGAVGMAMGEETEVGKALIKVSQALTLAAQIQTFVRQIQALTTLGAAQAEAVLKGSSLPFPANLIAIATTVATFASIIASVKGLIGKGGKSASTGTSSSASPENLGRNYAEGGMINGPRHAAGGVLINAEGGEAVMTRGAVTMFAPMLSMMNQMGGGTSFAGGALGASPDAPSVNQPSVNQQPMIMKTYVVSNELTTEAERQARLKDLSTL